MGQLDGWNLTKAEVVPRKVVIKILGHEPARNRVVSIEEGEANAFRYLLLKIRPGFVQRHFFESNPTHDKVYAGQTVWGGGG